MLTRLRFLHKGARQNTSFSFLKFLTIFPSLKDLSSCKFLTFALLALLSTYSLHLSYTLRVAFNAFLFYYVKVLFATHILLFKPPLLLVLTFFFYIFLFLCKFSALGGPHVSVLKCAQTYSSPFT